MSRLSDILLPWPIRDGWLHALLLFTFSWHFLFVALTLGTAMLATTYYVVGQWGASDAMRSWDREFLQAFFAHKSLAIVLGVAPILLMQVGRSVPFLTGVNVVAPLWMTLILCLLGALGLYEWQHRRKRERRWFFLIVTVAALALLVIVPGTFVAVLSSAERPRAWFSMLKLGGKLPLAVAVHWFFRLLHVLGAAAVVTAAFYYAIEAKENEQKRRHLLGWMSGGLAFQFVVGVGLYGTVRPTPSPLATGTMLVGVAAAAFLFFVLSPWRRNPWPSSSLIAMAIPLILMPMFLTRQLLQDRVLHPMEEVLRANAGVHSADLAPYRGPALAAFRASLATPYDTGLAIYTRSCSFCHGAVGNGRGESAQQLDVAPEDLSRMRMSDRKLTSVLLRGVDGSAMPRFNYYLEDELTLLRGFLRKKVGLKEAVETVPYPLTESDRADAKQIFERTCSVCHGIDGRGSDRGRPMRPAPTDFTEIGFLPSRAFEVISNGYPGTMMRPFADSIPVAVRWALVEQVSRLYRGASGAPEPLDAGAGLDSATAGAR